MPKFNIGDTVRVPTNVGDFATVLAVTDRLVSVEMHDESKMVRCFLPGELRVVEGPRFVLNQLVRVASKGNRHYLKEGVVTNTHNRLVRVRLAYDHEVIFHETQLEETDAMSRARRLIDKPDQDAEAKRRDLATLASNMTDGTDCVRTAYLALCLAQDVEPQEW